MRPCKSCEATGVENGITESSEKPFLEQFNRMRLMLGKGSFGGEAVDFISSTMYALS